MTGKEIVSDWWITVLSQDDINATDLRGLAVMIGAALAQARAEEREACAMLVLDIDGSWWDFEDVAEAYNEIAQAIRSRST